MRYLLVGNGSFLVNFDEKYQIRDIFYPHVGQENHTKGYPFRLGVWSEGFFSWISSDEWIRRIDYLPNVFVSEAVLTNKALNIRLKLNDTILGNKNVFLRKMTVENSSLVKVFLHHDFRIFSSKIGDCAFYDPNLKAIIHYKKRRYFLIGSYPNFNSFAVGRKAFHNLEGTWKDAEDGKLEQTAIAEGSVDSTIQINFDETDRAYYWICAGKSYEEVRRLNYLVLSETPSKLFESSKKYWSAWLKKNDTKHFSSGVKKVYETSLFIIRSHFDNCGAVVASTDSEVTVRATDHYSYMWPRDGAFTAYALDLAGYSYLSQRFFSFCSKVVHPEGYFLQKYNPDGTVASSWKPLWDTRLRISLTPIQEDSTALVLWFLWKHYEKSRNEEFIGEVYYPLIVKCADFIANFRNEKMNLPRSSWNLWEDRRGIHAFTVASVIAALRSAANFAEVFGDQERVEKYSRTAEEFICGIEQYLYDEKEKRFLRSLETYDDREFKEDYVFDSSLLWLALFQIFSAEDERIRNTVRAIEDRLWIKNQVGGLARYENDSYMRVSEGFTGNPWIVCTLWLADYYILLAKSCEELEKAREILEKVASWASGSGILAEQINPEDGSAISVSPLTWSHAGFVTTLIHFEEKLKSLTKGWSMH